MRTITLSDACIAELTAALTVRQEEGPGQTPAPNLPPAQPPITLSGRQIELRMPDIGNADQPAGVMDNETLTGWARMPSDEAQFNLGYQRPAGVSTRRIYRLMVNGVCRAEKGGRSASFTIAGPALVLEGWIAARAGDIVALEVTGAGDGWFQIQRTR